MNNQKAADAFAEHLKTTKNTNKSKTDRAKHHEKMVSLKTRETISRRPIYVKKKEDKKIKPVGFKNILRNRKNTAPVHYGISYRMLIHLSLEKTEILAQTIQTSVHSERVPVQRKTTTVTMIPKVGKHHKTLKGYRPLSLTSCLRKLCESIVNEHLIITVKTKFVRRRTKRLQIWQMHCRHSSDTKRKSRNKL